MFCSSTRCVAAMQTTLPLISLRGLATKAEIDPVLSVFMKEMKRVKAKYANIKGPTTSDEKKLQQEIQKLRQLDGLKELGVIIKE